MKFLSRVENQTLVAILLSVTGALLWPSLFLSLSIFGDLFLRLLKMVVAPLIFTSVFVSLVRIRNFRVLERLGWRTMAYYLGTTGLSVLTGLLLVNLLHPSAPLLHGKPPALHPFSLRDLLLGLFPENIVQSFARTEVIPIIFLALVLGISVLRVGHRAEPLSRFFEALNEALLILTRGIIRFTPLGVFFLVGAIIAREGLSPLRGLLGYVGTVTLGLFLHVAVTLPLLLYLFARTQPGAYFLSVREAPLLAFSTASSSATLPVTLEVAEEKAGISPEVAGFVLPLGSTINMDGTALYEAVAAMFIAHSYGLKLDLLQQILVFITAVLASVGAAGIPSAGLVTMTLVLQSVGLPLEGLGLILAVDRFLDMLRTSVNVWGDLVGAKIIDSWLRKEG
ncbi:MAG TPA: dicarboxylate/amino acid:cation symporter [Thermosulfurimonas dismutans]|uniref:Dicarboxylate/amino acid:cation symporter n=1 Tax=Thermosulfurimonas dismutans TaxID=999894 RepID=A0A7C3GR24_9BACT|nr:dicarboxylate/amino acid:cation symporter [Thermosulfurimonas dismutans]